MTYNMWYDVASLAYYILTSDLIVNCGYYIGWGIYPSKTRLKCDVSDSRYKVQLWN